MKPSEVVENSFASESSDRESDVARANSIQRQICK